MTFPVLSDLMVIVLADVSTPAWAALEAIKAPAAATAAATALRLSEADFLPCAWLISETAVHVWVAWFQMTLKTLFISIFL